MKKGDQITVISGKDKGKKGKVLRALPNEDKVIVEGINIKKRHQKPRKSNQKGQIIDIAAPIHVSNVMILDPKTSKPTRIGYKMDGRKKLRIAKKSGNVI